MRNKGRKILVRGIDIPEKEVMEPVRAARHADEEVFGGLLIEFGSCLLFQGQMNDMKVAFLLVFIPCPPLRLDNALLDTLNNVQSIFILEGNCRMSSV